MLKLRNFLIILTDPPLFLINLYPANVNKIESNISNQLEILQKKYSKFVEIGSYPFFRLGKIGVSIVSRSTSKIKLRLVNKEITKFVRKKKLKILKI